MTEVLVSSTVLILALAALRLLLRGRIDPRLQYALWLLAALRLLLPVPLVSSPVSVMNAAADVPAAVQRLTAPEDRRAPQPAKRPLRSPRLWQSRRHRRRKNFRSGRS